MLLIETIAHAWRIRMNGKAATPDDLSRAFTDVIRLVGDDLTYGLPQKRRRTSTRQAKHDCEIIRLVAQETQVNDHNADESEDHES